MRFGFPWLLALVLCLLFLPSSARAEEGPVYLSSFGSQGSGVGQFQHPSGIAISPGGNLWVADGDNDRVEELTKGGEFLAAIGGPESDEGGLSWPSGVAVDASGDVWVADTDNDRVVEFDEEGEILQAIGEAGEGDGQLEHPEALAIDGEGNVWVADTINRRIEEFDPEGEFVRAVTTARPEEELGEPDGVAFDAEGHLWVADWTNSRVDIFGASGEFLGETNDGAHEEGLLQHPSAIAVDGVGDVVVVDEGDDRVEEFDEEGNFVTSFGTPGQEEGEFAFSYPGGVAISSPEEVWVADSENDRVERWSLVVPSTPVCHPARLTIEEDEPLAIDVEHDCAGESPLRYTLVGEPAHGTVSAFDPEAGTFTYTPAERYVGTDSVTYVAENANGASEETTLEFQVEWGGGAPGLVAAYSFDEGEGSTVRDLVDDRDVTINGPEWTSEGKFGSALVFDGASQVGIPEPPGLTDEFTLEAWVRPHTSTEVGGPIFEDEDEVSFGERSGYSLSASPGRAARGIIPSKFGEREVESEAEIPRDEWTQVALTLGEHRLRIYVDGELSGESFAEPVRPNDQELLIGPGFDGRIDELRIYDRALSEEELQTDEETPLQARSGLSGPVAAYPLDEGEGDVAHDVVGEADATIEGAEWTVGHASSALHFDASSEDDVELPLARQLNPGTEFTYEAWVKPESTEDEEPGSEPVVVADTTAANGLYVAGSNGPPRGIVETSGSGPIAIEGTEPLGEGWTFLTLTSDAETLRLYVDGALVASAPEEEVTPSDAGLRLGAVPSAGHYLDGDIDGVRVYDRAISTVEVERDEEEDAAGPALTVTGPIFEASPETVVGPESPISIEVDSGESHVRQLQLLLGGEVDRTISSGEAFRHGAAQTCGPEGCHFSYAFDPSLGAGGLESPTSVGIRVFDTDGRSASRTHTARFDSTPPELSVEGERQPVERDESGELELGAHDGEAELETGISALRVEMDGEVVEEEELDCTASCPEGGGLSFEFEPSEWTEGPHRLVLTAVDGVGNEAEEVILIGAEPIRIGPDCAGPATEETAEADPVNVTQAREAVEERIPGAFLEGSEQREETFGEQYWSGSGSSWRTETGLTDARAEKAPGGNFTVGAVACLTPATVGEGESEAARFPSWLGIVNANSAPDTDTVLRPTPIGMAVIEDVRGPAAPTRFSWRLPAEESEELVELSDGAVALVKPSGIDVDPPEVPTIPAAVGDPEKLSAGDLQTEAGLDELAAANEEVEGQVMAVFAPPVALEEGGGLTAGSLAVEGDVLTAIRPEGTTALVLRASGAPAPAAICAEDSLAHPGAYVAACGPEPVEGGGSISTIGNLEGGFIYAFEAPAEEQGEVSSSEIYSMDAEGDDVRQLTDLPYQYYSPEASSDGSKIVVTRCGIGATDCGVYLLSPEDGSEVLLTADSTTGTEFDPTFSPDGEEVFFFKDSPTGLHEGLRDRQLYAISVSGEEERQITNVHSSAACGAESPCDRGLDGTSGAPAPSPDGETLIISADDRLWELPSDGEELGWEGLSALTGAEAGVAATLPAISADGSRLAYSVEEEGGGGGIFTMGLGGGSPEELVPYPAEEADGVDSIAFVGGGEELVVGRHGAAFELSPGEEVPRLLSRGYEPSSLTDALPEDPSKEEVEAVEAAEASELAESLALPAPLAVGEIWEKFEGAIEGITSASKKEWYWCLKNLVNVAECKFFVADRVTSIAMRERIFTGADAKIDRSTRGNAFQHAFWTALMVSHSVGEDGLVFALNHETKPLSLDAEQDVLNDFMGNNWRESQDGEPSDTQICEALREKSRRDLFVGGVEKPIHWANQNHYHFHLPVFRKLRSDLGNGRVVRLNGAHCVPGGES
jgi:DNA-binding beta-propeller fold protein YncE